jgi:hypothetical protein
MSMENQETLEDLLKSQEKIANRIKELKAEGRAKALADVLKTIKEYELTLAELKSSIVMRKPRAPNGEGVKKTKIPGAGPGRPRKVKAAE